MGRRKSQLPCPFPDCFSCPHPDCVKDQISEGRVSLAGMTPEERRARAAAQKRRSYERRREEKNRRSRERYWERKEREREAANEQKHLPDGQAGQRPDPGTGG